MCLYDKIICIDFIISMDFDGKFICNASILIIAKKLSVLLNVKYISF